MPYPFILTALLGWVLILFPHQTQPAEATVPVTKASPFASEIYAFLVEDQVMGIHPCRTLFVGSSSIRFWFTLQSDFADRSVVRRGFGGAHLKHVITYFDTLLTSQMPGAIVLYAGENDIHLNQDPQQVLEDLKKFLSLKMDRLGDVPVYFVSIKPSKARFSEFELQNEANQLAKRLAGRRSDLYYVNIVPSMMKDGAPKNIVIEEDLHMNWKGYALWTAAIQDAFARSGDPRASACS